MFATNTIRTVYKYIAKPLFFKSDPEDVHDMITILGNYAGKSRLIKSIFARIFVYENVVLEQQIDGVNYKNPIGLAAGFDKNGILCDILKQVGFGFEEVGSITWEAHGGNLRPRLWRLPEVHSLRVNYGLKNDGARCIYERLKQNKIFPLGISIAKSNKPQTVDLFRGAEDYCNTYKLFKDIGEYTTINISCPNTSEKSPIFAQPENLEYLLKKLQETKIRKPLYVKLAPDLTSSHIKELVDVCSRNKVNGFVCTNLTKKVPVDHQGKGGFSGKMVYEKSNELIAEVYRLTKGKKTIIGCGGIFNAEDAYIKIKLGANLLQLITGMIYEGPQLVGEINRELVRLIKADGYSNIQEAVGKSNPLT